MPEILRQLPPPIYVGFVWFQYDKQFLLGRSILNLRNTEKKVIVNFKNKLSFIPLNSTTSKILWRHKDPYNLYTLFVTKIQPYCIDTNSQTIVESFFSSRKFWNIVSPKEHKILNITWAVFIWIFSNPILYQYKTQEIWKMLSPKLVSFTMWQNFK